MSAYRPTAPFSVPMRLLKPTVKIVSGVRSKSFETPETGALFFGSFRTFGGTEVDSNGRYTLEDTATVDCWFNPDVKPNCRVYNELNGKTYEIVGTPENVEMRNQYMRVRLRAVGGQP